MGHADEMHDMIQRALASHLERDRLTAANAARTRRSLEYAGPGTSGQRSGARPRRRFALRAAAPERASR